MPLILPNTIANDQDADGDKLQQNFATISDWANQEAVVRDGSTAMTGALLLPGAPTQPNQAATKAYVDATGLIGEMKIWPGQTEPAGFMFCRGQAISRATYAALWAVLGTSYGAGDGSTTFNLPDMKFRSPVGPNVGGPFYASIGEKGGAATSVLPIHAHNIVPHTHPVNIWSGTQNATHNHGIRGSGYTGGGATSGFGLNFWADASVGTWGILGNTLPENQNHQHAVNGDTGLSSAATTDNQGTGETGFSNMSPFLTVNYIIKVA